MRIWRLMAWGFPLLLLLILCLSLAVPALAGANLLENGGFNGGFVPVEGLGEVAAGWTAFADPTGQPVSFSAGSFWGLRTQAIAGAGPSTAGVYQRISGLTPGHRYEAIVSVYPPVEPGAVRQIGIGLLGDTDPEGTMIVWSSAEMTGEWHHLIQPFPAITDSVTVFLRVQRADADGTSTTHFKNAYLCPEGSCSPSSPRAIFLPALPNKNPLPTPTATPTVTGTPTHTPTATSIPPTQPPPDDALLWDTRLDQLGVSVQRRDGEFRIIAAWLTINGSWDLVPDWARRWQQDTLGGDHHAFGRVENENGGPLNRQFTLWWGPGPADGDSRYPESDGWANIPLAGQNWNPSLGPGPYSWWVEGGDKLLGIGLPHNHHYSFFAVWQKVPPATPTPPPTPTSTGTLIPLTPTSTSDPVIPATPTSTRTPVDLLWDERLSPLNVTYESAAGKRYRLTKAFLTVAGSWLDVPGWALEYNTPAFSKRFEPEKVFGLCLDASGEVLSTHSFSLSTEDGYEDRRPAEPSEGGWAHNIIGIPYDPGAEETGIYRWGPVDGNQLVGLGLPGGQPYSFFGIWQEIPSAVGLSLDRPFQLPAILREGRVR